MEYIQSQNGQKDSTNNYLIFCPSCANKKLCVHSITGDYRCFICGFSGRGLKGLAEEDSRPYPVRLIDYLKSRSISIEAFKESGMRFSEDTDSILMPQHDKDGKEVGIHYKYLSGSQKYRQEGISTQFFIANKKLYDESDHCVIVEGQFDALTLSQCGINAIATCGAQNTKAALAIKPFKHIAVSFDNDTNPDTRAAVKKAAESLAFILKAKIIDASPGFKDINDYYVELRSTLTVTEARKTLKDQVFKQLNRIEHSLQLSDLTQDMWNYLSNKDLVKGEPTLVEGYDNLLGGGKRLGELTVTMAEAKTGKNTFWHYLMHKWLNKGIPVGYASRELTPETEVLPNLLSLEYKLNFWLAPPMTIDPVNALLSKWPLYFSKGYGEMLFDEIKAWIIELRDQKQVQYFWIDHLHYCLSDPEDFKEASKLIKQLKTLTKELNIHIDLIVQPNKLFEGQRLGLSALKGGSAIGQALDNLVMIERVKEEGKATNVSKITLDVARSKLAKTGSIYMEYDRDTTSFQEVEETKPDSTDGYDEFRSL